MRDFEAAVRRTLGPLPLLPERAEEIILELTHQVEDGYREALARGVPAAQAEAEAMAQLGDGEALRRSIVTSERGEKVWWPHPWAVPRAVCWMALAMVAALCLVPGFRQALGESTSAWSPDRPGLSQRTLETLAAKGAKSHDAHLLAFAALHLEDEFEASRLAEQAITLDPSFTWIGARFIAGERLPKDARVDRAAWARRVCAWDPENAAPRLLAAEPLFHSVIPAGAQGPADDPQIARLAETTSWGEQMQAAFRAPRYDAYGQRRFELVRSVAGSPSREALVWYSAQLGPAVPDFLQVQRYAALVTGKMGPEAERAGRYEQAAGLYWNVAQFGARMEDGAEWIWQRLPARKLEQSAYAALAALAERRGDSEEGAAFALISQRLDKARSEAAYEQARLLRARWQSAGSAAALAWFAACAVLLAGLGSIAWAVVAGRQRGERMLGGWRGTLAMGTSYAPGLLLGASCVLYSAMSPYLGTPSDLLTREAVFEEMAPFWFSYWRGAWNPMTSYWDSYAQHMFWPVLSSVAVLILGTALLRWMERQRAAHVE